MSKTHKVFVDGQEGTTGLRIHEYLAPRRDIELLKILNSPDVRDRILADGSEPAGQPAEAFRQFMLADTVKWAKLVKESGAKLD